MVDEQVKRLGFLSVMSTFCLLFFFGCASNSSFSDFANSEITKEQVGAQSWASRVSWRTDCGGEAFYEDGVLPSVDVFALGKAQLIKVVCSRGTYQPIQVLYLLSDGANWGELKCHKLPQIQVVESNVSEPFARYRDCLINGMVSVDEARKELTVYQRYRGAGGCGHNVKHVMVGDTFSPIEIKAKSACDADITPAELWDTYSFKDYQDWPEVDSPWRN